MHIDINSCFATIEQQANPLWRGQPIAVVAYMSPKGVILAPSIEAKGCGVKTGMRLAEGKLLCPSLHAMPPDPNKYRYIHAKLHELLSCYTNDIAPKSIDEFVLNFKGLPILKHKNLLEISQEIKSKIKKDIGEWLRVSIGIGPNRFLAKTAASFQKPDGLILIDHKNFIDIYKNLSLTDLNGINTRNELRLKRVGINSVLEFYHSPLWQKKAAFHSIAGYYWHLRLHGHEIDTAEFGRKSFGNSYSLPKQFTSPKSLAPILAKLVNKTSFRLRSAGFSAQGIHLGISYKDGTYWHKGEKASRLLFDTRDIYKKALQLLAKSPRKPVRNISVSCFNLVPKNSAHPSLQLELFEDIQKKQNAMQSLDNINEKWGAFTAFTANMLGTESAVPDRIAFGQS